MKLHPDHAQFFEVFMEQSKDGIWMVDLRIPLDIFASDEQKLHHFSEHGLITRCNRAFAQMYGFDSPINLIGISILKSVTPGDPQNIYVIRTFLNSPFHIEGAETHEVDKDGNKRWFLNDAWGIVEDKKLIRAWGRQWETTVHKQRQLVKS